MQMPTLTDRIWTFRNTKLIREIIGNADSIAISGHMNPDGDSLGSMLSLGLALKKTGKKVYMICCDNIPHNYLSLPGINSIQKGLQKTVDLAIAVDCGSKDLLGQSLEIFEKAKTILEIDHHRSRSPFGDVMLVDSEASSAGELIFELLQDLAIPITSDISQNILTSVLVETNSFRLPGIRPKTFEICANLLRAGADFYKLAETIYWVTSRETAMLTGICMSKCEFSQTGELAWATLTKKDFAKADANDSDADSVTEQIRSIKGVKIAILFREKNNSHYRVSIRSKKGINISLLAEQFGGGGHINAAGCTIPKNKKTFAQFLEKAEEFLLHLKVLSLQQEFYDLNPYHDEADPVPDNLLGISSIKVFDHNFSKKENIPINVYNKKLKQKIAS